MYKNYKNILLEHCQKNKIEFPLLCSKNIGQKPHLPIWYSMTDFNGESFEGEVKKTKIDAEQSLCQKILEGISLPIEKNSLLKKVKLSKNIALIVDLENNFNYESMENIYATYENLHMIGICSRNLNLKKEPSFEKMVVKSIAKDSADIAIVIKIIQLIINQKFDQIVLLTRDHFGKTLEEVVNSDFITFNTPIIHVMTDIEVHNFFNQFIV